MSIILSHHKLLRVIVGLNSVWWLVKIGMYIQAPQTTGGVLYWFLNIEYLYLLMLGMHVISVLANRIINDKYAWVVELELIFGVLISSSVCVIAYGAGLLDPENITTLLVATLIFFSTSSKRAPK